MTTIIPIVLLLTIATAYGSPTSRKPNFQTIHSVERINKLNTTWSAALHFENIPKEDLKALGKSPLMPDEEKRAIALQFRKTPVTFSGDLPESFDSRQRWPHCQSIATIRNQGCCGSCWAVSSAAAITDRICIHLNKTAYISAENIISCLKSDRSSGCQGGQPFEAFDFWIQSGLVTGGEYDSLQGCWPYSLKPRVKPQCAAFVDTPKCHLYCSNAEYPAGFKSDKHFGRERYFLVTADEMMREIYENGPIVAEFQIYEDFYAYKSGVYQKTTDEKSALHDVKVFGWGVENDVPYWLVANSWGPQWGDNGFFKILRGSNHCGIESYVAAALPWF